MRPGLTIGERHVLHRIVGAEHAIHLGAGSPGGGAVVLSTPAMIDLMEHAARDLLAAHLEANEESVGVQLSVEHLAATPVAAEVRAEAQVTAIDERQIDFQIAAFDQAEQIGRATHRRAVIRVDRFARRLEEKVQQHSPGAFLPMTLQPNHGDLPPLETLRVELPSPKKPHSNPVPPGLAIVTLNRPDQLNAVDRRMTGDWETLLAWLAGHPEQVRVVIVTGAGRAFCAGDDVKEVGRLSIDEARELSFRQARMYLAMERLPQVFIAAVNGPALGAGCVLACACDFRVAAHSAQFGMPEIRLGWPPGYGVAQLTALVGKSRAIDLCLTGRQITAQQALACGLAHEVTPLARLPGAAMQLATQLLALPAAALSETKRLVHADEGLSAKVAYLADTAAYIRCLQTADAREGIAAFGEKRPPRYQG